MAGALASTDRCEAVIKKSINTVDLLKELVRVFKESVFPWLLQALRKNPSTLRCQRGREPLEEEKKNIIPFSHMNDSKKPSYTYSDLDFEA